MRDKDDFLKKLQALIDRTKEYLKRDVWEKSFLLKRRRQEITEKVKSIEAARDDVLVKISQIGKEDVVAKQHMLQDIPDGTMVVYVLLSQKNGRDINAWETTLNALPSCSFGRPMYLKEGDVEHAITSQGSPLSSGYAAIYVDQEAIINDGKELDALGQAIISLKPGAIETGHIIKFVHYNTQSYFFVDKKLIINEKKNQNEVSHADKLADAVNQETTIVSGASTDELSESMHDQVEGKAQPKDTAISELSSDMAAQPEAVESEPIEQKAKTDDTAVSTPDDQIADEPASGSEEPVQAEESTVTESGDQATPSDDEVAQPQAKASKNTEPSLDDSVSIKREEAQQKEGKSAVTDSVDSAKKTKASAVAKTKPSPKVAKPLPKSKAKKQKDSSDN